MGVFFCLVITPITSALLDPNPAALPERKTEWGRPVQVAIAAVGSLVGSHATGSRAGTNAGATPGSSTAPSHQVTRPAAASGEASASSFVTTDAVEEAAPVSAEPTTTFAVIGDFGVGNRDEASVAKLVASWQPTYIVTVGDNYYETAGGHGAGAYARTVGKFYGGWLPHDFYPALGNHDYYAQPAPKTYLDYFSLPGPNQGNTSGNERYYDFVRGPVHFFVLNSNEEEPDGTTPDSKQGRWLREQLTSSREKFDVVICHHPPYCSGDVHGPAEYMRWPYAKWGADVVLSGHEHIYERVEHDGIPYVVDGVGGVARYGFGRPTAGSKVRYSGDFGALKVGATSSAMAFEFYSAGGELIDQFTLTPKWHAH